MYQLFQHDGPLQLVAGATQCWATLQRLIEPDGTAVAHSVEHLKGTQHALSKLVDDKKSENLLDSLHVAHRSRVAQQSGSNLNPLLSEEYMSFLSVDSVASVWVTQCPDYIGKLTDSEFLVTVADYLALPVPFCKPYVGMPLLPKAVQKARLKNGDARGLSFRCAVTTDDGWRRSHNSVLTALVGILKSAGLEVEKEPPRLFDATFPGVDSNSLSTAEVVGKITPDLRVVFPPVTTAAGKLLLKPGPVIGELKLIRVGALYDLPKNKAVKRHYAVERRCRRIAPEYQSHAAALDRRHYSVSPGPFAKRLTELGRLWGLVSGGFGEANGNLRNLLDYAARVVFSRDESRPYSEIKQRFYRRFAAAVYRAKASLLSRRLFLAHPNAAANADRWAVRLGPSSVLPSDAYSSWYTRHGAGLL